MLRLFFNDSAGWRKWLKENYDKETEVWLIFYNKKSGETGMGYEAAVEEALCYGWIDSIIRKVNDYTYLRKFTPRKEKSKWSDLNKTRVEKLIKNKKMTPVGLRLIEAAKLNGMWEEPARADINLELHPEFSAVIDKNRKAKIFYDKLAPTYKKNFIMWISSAKKDETRKRRIVEAVKLLKEGKKLGLK
ncbi:MAG: YdeI/OmpD-associated family protein [Melioribacteraceae bacterium]|nr:YdeI/OmpD-associated family protein [Melioribacteraceae bacterium]